MRLCVCVRAWRRPAEFSLLLRGLAFLGVCPHDEWLDELFARSEAGLRDRGVHVAQAANLAWAIGMLKVRRWSSRGVLACGHC